MIRKRMYLRKRWFLLLLLFVLFINCAGMMVDAAQEENIGVKKILGVSPDGAGSSYLNYVSPVSGEEFRVSLHRTEDDLVAYCLDRTKDSDYNDYNRNYFIEKNYKENGSDILRNILLCGYPGNTATQLKKMYGYSTNKRNAEQATQMAIWISIYMQENGVSAKNAWKAHSPKNTGDYSTVELSKAILNRALKMDEQSISAASAYVGKDENNVTYEFMITAKSQYFPIKGTITGLPDGAGVTADKPITYSNDGSFEMNLADGTARIRVSFSRYVHVPSVVMKVNGTIPVTSDHDGILFYKNSDSGYQDVVVAKDASPVYTEKKADFSYKADQRIQIRIKKEDSSGQGTSGDGTLEGAEYTIYDEKGNQREVLTIGKDRQAVSGPLPVGTYTVKETKAPVGYLLDQQVYQVDGRNPDPNLDITTYDVLSKEDVIRSKIRIVKTLENPDHQSDEIIPAKGVVFTYYLNSKPEKKMTITLDEEGKGESDWMPYGTYTLEETTVPRGWKKVVPKTVVIAEHNKPYTYYMTDMEDSSDCKLIKKDKETGKIIGFSGTRFQIRKKDTGNLVTMYDENNKKVDEFVTNDEGYVVLPEKLQAGDYLLYELEAPKGYVKESEPTPFTVPDNYDGVVEVTMSNEPQRIRLTVNKTGEVFADILEENWKNYAVVKPVFEDQPLKGVVYQLTAMEDILTGDGTVRIEKGTVFESVTGEDGKAVFEDLYPGEYELLEKEAPDGYLVKKEPERITLVCGDSETVVKEENIQYRNAIQKPSIVLEKWMQKNPYIDLEAPEEVVVFGLYTKEDIKDYNEEIRIKADTLLDVFCINKDRQGVSQMDSSLPYGTYYMKELETHPLYLLDENVYEFTFQYDESSEEIQTISVTKDPVVNEMAVGIFRFHKQDSENKGPLKGCVIALKNDAGKVIAKGETDAEGNLEFSNLPIGKYTYSEVSAPEGYVLDDTARHFEIAEHDVLISVVMENGKEKIIVEENYDESSKTQEIQEEKSIDKIEEKHDKKVEKLTKTGDDTPIHFWAVFALLSFTLMVTCDIFLRKKK